ncbi:hypothetical protein ACLB2K_039604 [Fragaria x ananassa]
MAENDTVATTPPQMAEEEEDPSPIGPESGEETAVRPEPTEENTAAIQPVSEEENPQPQIAEEEEPPQIAATTRPESGEEKAVGSEPEEENTTPIEIASEEENEAEGEKENPDQPGRIRLELPTGRVKKIMKLDPDINKINTEALHLVSCSAQLFLQFLAEGSGEVAMEKKRKIVKLEHIRTAAKRHRATRDFLVDELPCRLSPPIRSLLIGAALARLLTIRLRLGPVGLMTSLCMSNSNKQLLKSFKEMEEARRGNDSQNNKHESQ